MKRRSTPNEGPLERRLPSPDFATLDLNEVVHLATPLSRFDASLVEGLKKELTAAGILRQESTSPALEAQDDVNTIVEEARAAAKHEKELNPDYYAPEVDALLGEDLTEEEDWANPFEVSDPQDYEEEEKVAKAPSSVYSEDVFPTSREHPSPEAPPAKGPQYVQVRLPDGTYTFAEII